jgi:uncharacterized membrane protein
LFFLFSPLSLFFLVLCYFFLLSYFFYFISVVLAFCAAAEQHGAVMADGSIWIGGTRFTPQQIKEKT